MQMNLKFWCAIFLLFASFVANSADRSVTRIAAASSMRFLLEELLAAYNETESVENKSKIQVVYGSSGNLYRQISQGAPYHLFFSADDSLARGLVLDKASNLFIIGQGELVLYSNGDSGVSSDNLIDVFRSSLLSGRFSGKEFKVAIANPAHAPYGLAAKQALQTMQLWQEVQSRLVTAEKVSQAAQFALTGAVEFALVPGALANSIEGVFTSLPGQWYEPVRHSIAMVQQTTTGEKFLTFLESRAATAILGKYGFH